MTWLCLAVRRVEGETPAEVTRDVGTARALRTLLYQKTTEGPCETVSTHSGQKHLGGKVAKVMHLGLRHLSCTQVPVLSEALLLGCKVGD